MKAYRVSGTSMWPVLKDGDLVLAQQVSTFKFSSLLVRHCEGLIVLHRRLSPELTKGDRYLLADPPLLDSDAVLEVTHVVPRSFSDLTGPLRHCRLAKPGFLFRGRLELLQGQISKWQLNRHSKIAKRFATAVLIANGFFIRCCYYFAALKGRPDAKLTFET